MGQYSQYLEATSWLLVTIAGLETVILYLRGVNKNPKESLANFFIYVVRKGPWQMAQRAVQFAGLTFFYSLTPLRVPMGPDAFLIALLLVDFLYWFKHYLEHRNRFLWTIHSVHHSSEEFNLSTALRLPWIGAAILWVFYVPAVLLGFDPAIVLLCNQLVLLYQFWIHSAYIPKLGVLESIFNTPSNHRVHHGSNRRYLDKNFGGILIIWDRMFKTYRAEKEPVRYGLTTPIGTSNPFIINFAELGAFIKDVVTAASFGEALKIMVKSPGYKPRKKTTVSLPESSRG